MGDFEDVFGAGADAVNIIEGFSREYERSSWKEKENWYGASSGGISKAGDRQEGTGNWSVAMAAKGYTKGPEFISYGALSAWDCSNSRPHVRSRSDQGYQIYFTDGQSYDGSESTSVLQEGQPTRSIDNDMPF